MLYFKKIRVLLIKEGILMGSSGSGKFGTYHYNEKTINKSGVGMSGSSETSVGEIECPNIIEHISLEDVSTSEYFQKYRTVPPKSLSVTLRPKVYQGRLVVELTDTKEILGNIPTQYNLLLTWMEKGITYSGEVTASGLEPIPFIMVTLNA